MRPRSTSRPWRARARSNDPRRFARHRIPGLEAKAEEHSLPIIGRVAAGAPILAEQHIEESCNINPAFFHPRADYLLRVHGMSMKDVGIFDGDLLAVHTTREARNGQVVVARIGDEVTVNASSVKAARSG
jgi:repressor LexA